MASFQAKIVWKKQTKRENKNYSFITSLPDALQKIPKNSKKIQKNSKTPLSLHFKTPYVEGG